DRGRTAKETSCRAVASAYFTHSSLTSKMSLLASGADGRPRCGSATVSAARPAVAACAGSVGARAKCPREAARAPGGRRISARGPRRDELAEVQDEDALGQIEYDLDVMLDQDQRDVFGLVEARQRAGQQ